MRTEFVNVYKFDELSASAKEKAIEWARSCFFENGYHWADEWHETLQKFCEAVGLKWRSSNVSTYPDYDVSFSNIEDNILRLSGKRLIAWLTNNLAIYLWERKTYHFCRNDDGSRRMNCVGYNSGKYVSKCQIVANDCPFTGYCGDEDILQPIRDYLKKPDMSADLEDVFLDCLSAWEKAVRSDCEWQESDEYLAEHIEANEYEFTEDGKRY